MRVLHFVEQCTVLLFCASSVALGWPFTQHRTLKARKQEKTRGPGFLTEVNASQHSKYLKKEDRSGNNAHSHQNTDKTFIKSKPVQNAPFDTTVDEDYIERRSGNGRRFSFPLNPQRITFPQRPYTFSVSNPGHIRFSSRPRDVVLPAEHGETGVKSAPSPSILEEEKPKKHEKCQLENGIKLIPCGSNTSQCLRDDMICDNHRDCDGGEDEDAGSCLLRNWVLKRLKEIKDVIHKDKTRKG